jgi:isopentenyl-diphosphate delta-isomerase
VDQRVLWTPRPGEDAEAAALRRLEEEMGFTCALESLGTIRYRAELDHGMIEHELVHTFRGLYDGPIAPNPAEAEGYQWARLEDVRADVAVMPQRFSAWFFK